MKNSIMSLAVTVACLCSAAIADEVPTFDVSRSCRAEAGGTGMGTTESCLDDERNARDRLVQEWAQFSALNKQSCLQTSTDMSGTRSYVELLTCLQMARDAKTLPKADRE